MTGFLDDAEFTVDGWPVSWEEWADAMAIGHLFQQDYREGHARLSLTSVDSACPPGYGVVGYDPFDGDDEADGYLIDFLGTLASTVSIAYEADHEFVVDGVDTDIDGVRAALNPMDCVFYTFPIIPGDTSPPSHDLANREWHEF